MFKVRLGAVMMAGALAGAVGACMATPSGGTAVPHDAGTGPAGSTGAPADGGGVDVVPTSFTDFPAGPILVDVPDDAPSLFGGDTADAAGPCLVEPEDGSLVPRNWLRQRFRWRAAPEHNLFELRLTAPNQERPLVVYTADNSFILPAEIWTALVVHSLNQPISVALRAARYETEGDRAPPTAATTATFTIAPVSALGQIVYWTTSGGSALKGFSIGEESVREVLRPSQSGSRTRCIGCHASTPDGRYAAFSASSDAVNGVPSRIAHRSLDGTAAEPEPEYISAAARALLARVPQQQPFFSNALWTDQKRVILSMLKVGDSWEIAWTNLISGSEQRALGWDVITRSGDLGGAAAATARHDGTAIAYASAPDVNSGVNVSFGRADLYTVPFGEGHGGAAAPLRGASEADHSEYYPSYSPDDRFVAFNRVPATEGSYNNANAEIFVVPSEGGSATRLRGNDPPACLERPSPGVTNSWPKWSPAVAEVDGRSYYWLTFSSTREHGLPQIYVAPVVVEGETVTTYPALTLWNQPAGEANHTAAWDVFKIR